MYFVWLGIFFSKVAHNHHNHHIKNGFKITSVCLVILVSMVNAFCFNIPQPPQKKNSRNVNFWENCKEFEPVLIEDKCLFFRNKTFLKC